jgi:translation initiation factor IF-1
MGDENIRIDAIVDEILPNAMFRVTLENDKKMLVYTSGKLRKLRIKIVVGDKVTVEFSPYDISKGRIVKRL